MNVKQFYGDRMKNARLFRGITLTELSLRTGISKQSLSLYENGENYPDSEKGQKIAIALKFPYDFFLYHDHNKISTDVTYFRSLTSATKMSRTSQSIKLEFVAQIYEVLLNYIDFPNLELPDVDFDTNSEDLIISDNIKEFDQIEQIARSVRECWNLGMEPIDDLQYELEKHGIIVTGFNTEDDKIDAFSQRTSLNNGTVYFICVDQGKDSEGRIRFDMAHELGHILLHPWSESLELISKDEFKARERQANMFASAFLLPKESFGNDVKAYATDLNHYLWLKKKWKSSIQSMIYRSHKLEIISSNQYQYLMRQVSRKGWRTKEPYDEPFPLNENIFQGALDLLFEQGVFSPSSIMLIFKNHGIALFPKEIEKLLCLREGTLSQQDNHQSNFIHLKPR